MKVPPSPQQLTEQLLKMKALGYWPLNELFGATWQGSTDVWAAKMLRLLDDSEALICPAPCCPLTSIGEKYLEYGQFEVLFVKPGKRQQLLDLLNSDSAVLTSRRREAKLRQSFTGVPDTVIQLPVQKHTAAQSATDTQLLDNISVASRELTHNPQSSEGIHSDENEPSSWKVATYWAFLPIIIFIGLAAENPDKPDISIKIIAIGGLLWILLPVWAGIGKNTAERAKNTLRVMAFICVFAIVVGAISMVLPSSCTGTSSHNPTDLYYRK